MHFFEFHFQKILSATKGWKDDEFGAYVKLLIEQFDRGFIPDDPDELSRLITTFKKNWPRLKKKFAEPSDPGQLRNAFMKKIREEAHAKSAKNAESGKKGGEAKKRNGSERLANAIADAKQTPKRNGSQPVTSNQEPVSKENTVVVKDIWFEMFRRAAGPQINDDELILEIGKFKNKYGNKHPNQAGALINTWVSKIGVEKEQIANEIGAIPEKKMVL
jgi:uncharacterized protein YdaU (DUF1376 family)